MRKAGIPPPTPPSVCPHEGDSGKAGETGGKGVVGWGVAGSQEGDTVPPRRWLGEGERDVTLLLKKVLFSYRGSGVSQTKKRSRVLI